MLKSFFYQNIEFRKYAEEDILAVTGEISNKSGRNYHSVVFKITVFIKTIPVGNATLTINGFLNGQTRTFTRRIGELVYSKVIKDISHCEIYPESAY